MIKKITDELFKDKTKIDFCEVINFFILNGFACVIHIVHEDHPLL